MFDTFFQNRNILELFKCSNVPRYMQCNFDVEVDVLQKKHNVIEFVFKKSKLRI